MSNKRCVVCEEKIGALNNSKEHLIPRSIGGRKKVKYFICRGCNNSAGETWDAALAEALNPLSLLFKIKREGSDVPSQQFETISGEQIVLKHDGSMELPKPKLIKKVEGEKVEISIQARSVQEARKIVAGLKKKHPSLDEENILQKLTPTQSHLKDPLKMSFAFGGDLGGRSIVKSALALATLYKIDIEKCKTSLNYLRKPGEPACFGFFYERDLILNRPQDRIFHCVAISNRNLSGQLLGYVEFFGAQRVVICLSEHYSGSDVHHIYAIDPISGQEVDLEFELNLSAQDIEDTYNYKKIPDSSIEEAFRIPLTLAIENDFERERNRVLNEAVDYAFKNCGVPEGEILTEKDLIKISSLVSEKLQPFLRRHLVNKVTSPRKEDL